MFSQVDHLTQNTSQVFRGNITADKILSFDTYYYYIIDYPKHQESLPTDSQLLV